MSRVGFCRLVQKYVNCQGALNTNSWLCERSLEPPKRAGQPQGIARTYIIYCEEGVGEHVGGAEGAAVARTILRAFSCCCLW